MSEEAYSNAFRIHGQDFSKMQFRAFVLYSRNYAFAQRIFPEFEQLWVKVKEEWLKNDTPENEQYFVELYNRYKESLK